MTEAKHSVCIIGSGPAGSILAGSLAQREHKVCVIESGTESPDYDLHRGIKTIETSGSMEMRFGFSRQLGGATNLWSGRVAPLDEIDFIARDWIPLSGWPLDREELLPYYREAAQMLGILPAEFFEHPNVLPADFEHLEGTEQKRFIWNTPPMNCGQYLKECAQKYSNLKILSGSTALKLNIKQTDNSHVVHGVEIIDLNGHKETIQADLFVVAAGGIETPRLMLNSGVDNHNIGKYLSTHPKADMAVLVLNQKVSPSHPLFADCIENGQSKRFGLGFTAEEQKACHLLNHYVQLSPVAEYKASRLFEKVKGSSIFNSHFIDDSSLLRGLLPAIGLYVFNLIGRMAGKTGKTRMFMLRAFLDQIPNPANRVALSTEMDTNDIPKADIHWQFSEQDRLSVIAFHERLDQCFRTAGIGRIEYEKMKALKDWPLTGIHSHFMGTTRMGNDPQTSVTDKDACVHGFENLYVSGPSLFPTYGFANPVFTIMALALRLSAHIGGKYPV